MQSGYTGYVTSSEWRWVIWASAFFIILAFTPFLWIVLNGVTDTGWEFMGIMHDYENGATQLSRILQGRQGNILSQFLHTPEANNGTFFDMIYPIIGQLSRLVQLPVGVTFHIGRVVASLFMYMAIYQMAATIWMRIRTRRLFFAIAVGGTGFGWFFGVITQDASYLDLTAPEVFPFFSSLANIHFPLTIGCMAFLTSLMVRIFRPGADAEPTVNNEGILIFALGLILAILYPLALMPILITFILMWLLRSYQAKKLVRREAYWLLWFVTPTLPIIAYYGVILGYEPIVGDIWRQINTIPPPNLLVFALSLGLPLAIAMPAIIRALRRFEPDGDQFMFLWLVIILLLIYLPTEAQRRFSIGLMLPIAYFATRAVEDFWFGFIVRRWRYRLLAILIPIMGASHLFMLYLPTRPIVTDNKEQARGMVLEQDYISAFDWLDSRVGSRDIILASPRPSLWIPVATGARVVFGHPAETADSRVKNRAVMRWYEAESADDPICDDLLNGVFSLDEAYRVLYVIVGSQERDLGANACVENLDLIQTMNTVEIYSVFGNLDTLP